MPRHAMTIYFDEPGPANTEVILRAAIERAGELACDHLIVASTTGQTGRLAAQLILELAYPGRLVVVGQHAGFREPGEQPFTPEARRELESGGAAVVIATHSLSSAARSFRLKYGGIDMLETIADTLRRVSQGFKVGVECALMAADAGAIPVDRDVVAVGGSGSGADTAIVVRPTNQNRFFDLKVREIVGMPR